MYPEQLEPKQFHCAQCGCTWFGLFLIHTGNNVNTSQVESAYRRRGWNAEWHLPGFKRMRYSFIPLSLGWMGLLGYSAKVTPIKCLNMHVFYLPVLIKESWSILKANSYLQWWPVQWLCSGGLSCSPSVHPKLKAHSLVSHTTLVNYTLEVHNTLCSHCFESGSIIVST